MPPVIDETKCIGCGTCADICCMDVIKKIDNKIIVCYPNECWHCRACAIDCPVEAIKMRYPLSHVMLHVSVPAERGEE